MAMRALVVAEDPSHAAWLGGALGEDFELDRSSSYDPGEALARIEQTQRTDVVFVQVDNEGSGVGLRLIRALNERHAELPVVALGSQGHPDMVLGAVRAGALDYLVRERDDQQLAELVVQAINKASGAGRTSSEGRVFTVVSGHAYDGVAFFAEHLALACLGQQQPGRRVVLVDAASPNGAAAVYLNLNQAYTLLDAVNDLHRCDQTLVETAFTKHASGLYVLSLPEELVGSPSVDHDALLRLVEVFRSLFAVTVVTLDSNHPMHFLTDMIALADRNLLLSDQSILKSRHNKYLLRALRLEDCSTERMGLVVDNYRRRLGLEPDNLGQLLELPLLATLSGQGVNRIQSMNTGEPLYELAPRDPYCREVDALAAGLLDGREAEVAAPGLLERLFG